MSGGENFNIAEEFANVDFNEARLEKRSRYRKTSGAGYGENQDADLDVFGYRGVYYESDLYSAGKSRTAVHDTV
jgi:hypothetical protein